MASRRWLTLVVAGALAATACDRAPAAQPTPDRVTEIRAARRAVASAPGTLQAAATDLAASVSALRLGDPPAPSERLEAVRTLVADSVSRLSAALSAADEITIPGSSADVVLARRAWDEVREAARELVGSATADLAQIERLARADAELAEVVAGWDEAGSYTEQLDHFAELAARAATLADDLEDLPDRPPCAGAVARRVAAARSVADATLELRGLIEARDGLGFDARREVLASNPYDLGRQQIAAADEDDRACWERDAATVRASDAVVTGLRELESALNPPDLTALGARASRGPRRTAAQDGVPYVVA